MFVEFSRDQPPLAAMLESMAGAGGGATGALAGRTTSCRRPRRCSAVSGLPE